MGTLKLFPIQMYFAAQALRDREEGQAMLEYALIVAIVSLAGVTLLKAIGGTPVDIFNSVNADF